MRIKRLAKARKSLEFFVRAFSFEQPFKFLIDPDFVLGILKGGLGLRESLQNLISVKTSKIFITTCIRRELEALAVTPGPRQGEWKLVLGIVDNRVNGVQYVACKHPKEIKCTAHECIKWSVAPAQHLAELNAAKTNDDSDDGDGDDGKDDAKKKKKKEKKSNPEHFIACVQHSQLRHDLRQIPAVPTLYMHSAALVFDEPSKASKEYAERFKVGHHQKMTARQNISILSSLQRYAPEKNQVLDEALLNGGVYGVAKAVVPEGTLTRIIEGKNKAGDKSGAGKAGQVNKNGQMIGKKAKPRAPNPLSNKKAQAKQMPSVSFKNQKKMAAAAGVEPPVSQPNKKQKGNAGAKGGDQMVQLSKPTQKQQGDVKSAMKKPVAGQGSAPGKRKAMERD